MKNHYRAHQLSVWLRLVPELHRAGMEDVDSRHNLFRGHSDPNLYDGSVRPDPLSRISEEFKKKNITTEPPTTTDYNAATCVSYIQSTNLQNVHNASTDTLASLDAAGYVISNFGRRNENINKEPRYATPWPLYRFETLSMVSAKWYSQNCRSIKAHVTILLLSPNIMQKQLPLSANTFRFVLF